MTILNPEDTITNKTFYRPLIHRVGEDDITHKEYRGAPINNTLFISCKRGMPALIGKTVAEVNKRSFNMQRSSPYIFVNDVPDFLREPLTKSEYEETLYREYLSKLYFKFIKKSNLKGKSALYIMENDKSYFDYLYTNDCIDSVSYKYMNYCIERENKLWAGSCGLDVVDWHNSSLIEGQEL